MARSALTAPLAETDSWSFSLSISAVRKTSGDAFRGLRAWSIATTAVVKLTVRARSMGVRAGLVTSIPSISTTSRSVMSLRWTVTPFLLRALEFGGASTCTVLGQASARGIPHTTAADW